MVQLLKECYMERTIAMKNEKMSTIVFQHCQWRSTAAYIAAKKGVFDRHGGDKLRASSKRTWYLLGSHEMEANFMAPLDSVSQCMAPSDMHIHVSLD